MMKMSQYEYEKVEKPFIEELIKYDYTHYTGTQLEGERQQNHIILEKRFRAAIKPLD